MKNILLKFRDGIVIGAGIVTMLAITHAAVNLTASENETLTHTKWNELVDKVDGIFTDGSGNVGIGTETPSSILEISSSNTNNFIRQKNINSISSGLVMGIDGNQDFHIRNNEDGDIRLGDSDNPYNLVVKNDGKVGIGTPTPTRDLSIFSTSPGIYFTDIDDNSDNQISSYQGGQLWFDSDINDEVSGGGFYFRNNGSSIDFHIASNGSVGIRNENPQSALQVGKNRNGNTEYIQLDVENYSNPSSTDCNSVSEEGKIVFAGTTNRLYICDGDNGWRYINTVN